MALHTSKPAGAQPSDVITVNVSVAAVCISPEITRTWKARTLAGQLIEIIFLAIVFVSR